MEIGTGIARTDCQTARKGTVLLLVASFVMGLCISGPAIAGGAFGIEQGTPISAFPDAKPVSGRSGGYQVFQISSPPKPHDEFKSYLLVTTPATGICKILGLGKKHQWDRSGSEIRTSFNSMKEALISKYGVSDNVDDIQATSIWKGLNEFSMALTNKERFLLSYWDRSKGSTMPDDINTVGLQANAEGGLDTYLTINYEFSNFKQCQEEQKKRDNSGL